MYFEEISSAVTRYSGLNISNTLLCSWYYLCVYILFLKSVLSSDRDVSKNLPLLQGSTHMYVYIVYIIILFSFCYCWIYFIHLETVIQTIQI